MKLNKPIQKVNILNPTSQHKPRASGMSISDNIKNMNRAQISALGFFVVAGILLLAMLPLSSYPPHLGFLGIVSLITAYSILTKRPWANWLIFILVVINTVFGLYTLSAVGLSNIIVAAASLAYTALTLAITAFLVFKRKD